VSFYTFDAAGLRIDYPLLDPGFGEPPYVGLPFLAAGLAYRRAMEAFDLVRRHRVLVTRVGGGMLVVVGVLLVSGVWGVLMQSLKGSIAGFETVL